MAYGRIYDKLAFDPSGNVLISKIPDRLEMHDATTGASRRILEIAKHQVLSFSPSDRYVAIQNLDSEYAALGRVSDVIGDRFTAG